jgi:hypothetical protein
VAILGHGLFFQVKKGLWEIPASPFSIIGVY